jgi:hypothetical protein
MKGALIAKSKITHGMTVDGPTPEYYMFHGAKRRAEENGIPFNIKLSDVVIPTHCPLLPSLKLCKGNKTTEPTSPSLDRKIPSLGYVKGNVWVISHRANTIKNDATREELMEIATNFAREVA